MRGRGCSAIDVTDTLENLMMNAGMVWVDEVSE